jgi:putative ABC transport system substrate-binding protein
MTRHLHRRAFVALAGGTALQSLIPARAIASQTRTVGVLIGLANDAETRARSQAFEQGLAAEGWTIGKDLRLIYRFANGDRNRMAALAHELVAHNPDCILAHSTPVVTALTKATQTIPVVFVSVSDPIGSGFVATMARPGGNMTGFTLLQPTIPGKYLSMLREIVPHLTHVTLMYNPASVPAAGEYFMPSFLESTTEYKLRALVAKVNSQKDIETAINELAMEPGGALITVPDNFLSLHRDLIIALTAQLRVPAVYPYRYFAEAGGLLSYGVDAVDLFRRATDYVSRILRGAKPADLPVQGPTKFETVINLKTAHALGLVVPRFLIGGADAVLE